MPKLGLEDDALEKCIIESPKDRFTDSENLTPQLELA